MILSRKEVSIRCNENPVMKRDECIKKVRHGGAGIVFHRTTYCLTCHTEFTKQDSDDRVRAMGGPGHWLGCKLHKLHKGDCLV